MLEKEVNKTYPFIHGSKRNLKLTTGVYLKKNPWKSEQSVVAF